MRRIAVVEDDQMTNDRLKTLLDSVGDVEVIQLFNLATAETVISQEHFDLLVLDIDLGAGAQEQFAGFKLLSKFGSLRTTIIVSGMPEENLQPVALSLNAYDFIGKPINDLDFLNKVKHALAWPTAADTGDIAHASDTWPESLELDVGRRPHLLWRGQPVKLTLTELTIVHSLVEQTGQVVPYRILAVAMKSSVSPRALATHITGVRKKFVDVDPTFDRIESEPAKGYFWKTGV